MQLIIVVFLFWATNAYSQNYPSPTLNGLSLTGSQNYAGASTQNNSWLWMGGTSLSGAGAIGISGVLSPMNLYINSDTVDTTTNGANFLTDFSVKGILSAGSTGGRTAIQGWTLINGQPSLLSSAGYVGILGQTSINTTLGGAAGSYSTYKGSVFAGNSNLFATGNATYILVYNAHEFDVALPTGASAAEKHAISLVKTSSDAVRATYDDSALEFSDQDSTGTTWTYGILFGAYAHKYPFGTDSTLIGATSRSVGSTSSAVALNGVDFSGVTFSSGGCAFKSPGYCVLPNGVVQLPSFTVATLPTCSTTYKGGMAYVTDAVAPTYNAALTGGGAVVIPVFCNGSSWTAH